MGRSPVLALAIVAAVAAAIATAAAAAGEVKCGGCTPCVGADCPVLYPSPPPPALPPPPPYYYYSPPPPATYPGSSYCPPPPGAYIQIGSTPPGKGPLYPQDPGFMPSAAPTRAVPPLAAVVGALAALVGVWVAFL